MNSSLKEMEESLKKINNINYNIIKFNNISSNMKLDKQKYNKYITYINKLNEINSIINNSLDSLVNINLIVENYNNSYNKIINILNKYNISPINNVMNNYINIYNKKINYINNYKNIEYLTIINNINSNTFNNIFSLIEDNLEDINKYSKYIEDIKDNNELKPVESTISKYIGYAYRNDATISIRDAYDKTIIHDIVNNANEIMNKIKIINIKYPEFFLINQDTVDMGVNIKDIADNEAGFTYIINLLFKAIYENSGTGNNRIYELANNKNNALIKDKLDIIKNIRSYYDHTNIRTDKKKIKFMHNYVKNKIGIELPIHSKDWVKLQLYLYKDINEMLELIISVI